MKERLIQFIAYLKLGQNKFEKSCGIAIGTIRNTTGNMTQKTLTKILSTYPELNQDWLLTGEGKMLKEDDQNILTDKKEEVEMNLKQLLEHLNDKQAIIEFQKSEIERLKKEVEALKNATSQGMREGRAS